MARSPELPQNHVANVDLPIAKNSDVINPSKIKERILLSNDATLTT